MKTLGIDVVAVFAFAVFARIAHGGLSMVLQTFWPFAIGTVLGTLICRGRTQSLPAGVIVWLSTVGVGLAIWAVRHDKLPHISFIIVASVMSGLLLLGWRWLKLRQS